MRATLDQRIARATLLSATYPESAALLSFYGELLAFQKPVFEQVRSSAVTNVRALASHFPRLIELVTRAGTEPLSDFASSHLRNTPEREKLLVDCWEGESPTDAAAVFFGRVILQPYAEYLATRGDVEARSEHPVCPFCGNRPVVAALRGEGDGGKRWLTCSLCSTEWQYRRIICPNCAEEDKDKLPVYTASGIDYIRVDACDTCHTYIKSVDLTKNGLAVPAVDEIATVALNIWADEHGYTKLESNLLGI